MKERRAWLHAAWGSAPGGLGGRWQRLAAVAVVGAVVLGSSAASAGSSSIVACVQSTGLAATAAPHKGPVGGPSSGPGTHGPQTGPVGPNPAAALLYSASGQCRANQSAVTWPTEAAFQAVAAQQTAAATAISGLQSHQATDAASIQALQSQQGTDEAAISALKTQNAALQQQQQTDQTAIANLKATVQSLQSAVQSLDATVQALQTGEIASLAIAWPTGYGTGVAQLHVGSSFPPFVVTVHYVNGRTETPAPTAVTWSSSDPSVVTIANGEAIEQGLGTASITATFEGVTSNTLTISVITN